MTSALRRLVFTTHVASSVGWLGAVLVFLGLALIGLTSQHEPTVRGAYLVMAPAAWFVLVPLAHASLLSGIAIALGSRWGLLRHYWVASKLLLTLFATIILLIYMGTFRQMAGVAGDPAVELGLVRNPSPVVHAVLALILLVAATLLGVYKPFGMTPYGRRKSVEWRQSFLPDATDPGVADTAADKAGTPRWLLMLAVIAIAIVLLFLLSHLSGAAFPH